ncbi:sortase domain-bontaining protein [uncultured Ruminococcus sp.]|nr:sortase [uncultured Ruminococcus sp.]
MFLAGLIAFVIGASVLGVYGCRKIIRVLRQQKLMQENVVIEIPDLNIKAPVLEGTGNDTLSIAAGHFTDTGEVGSGNYCIAGHSSTIYKEYFKATPHKERLMALHVICLHIFRHISQKCS